MMGTKSGNTGKRNTGAGKGKGLTIAEMTQKMEPKQIQLAMMMAQGNGISKIAAFRQVYGMGLSDGTQRNKSVILTTDEPGKTLIETVRDNYDRPALRDPATTRRWIMSRLHDLAENGEQESTRAKALELAGKASHVAMFTDRQEVIHRGDGGEDIRVELRERLAGIMGSLGIDTSDCIDVDHERPLDVVVQSNSEPNQSDLLLHPKDLSDSVVPDNGHYVNSSEHQNKSVAKRMPAAIADLNVLPIDPEQ